MLRWVQQRYTTQRLGKHDLRRELGAMVGSANVVVERRVVGRRRLALLLLLLLLRREAAVRWARLAWANRPTARILRTDARRAHSSRRTGVHSRR